MRRVGILITSILTITIILITMVIPTSAASQTSNMTIDYFNALYFGTDPNDGYFEVMYDNYSVTSGNIYNIDFPATVTSSSKEYNIRSVNILSYADSLDYSDLWQQGYIYTFEYEIRVKTKSVPEVSAVTFDFGIAQTDNALSYIAYFQPLGDIVYTYSKTSANTTFYVTATVYVDSNFNTGNVPNLETSYLSLEMSLHENTVDTISVRASNLTVNKAIGEDAYYQSSIDAITNIHTEISNMSQNEYEWTIGFLDPDGLERQITKIQGDVEDVTNEITNRVTGLYDSLIALSEGEPVIYFPSVTIPFVNVNINSLPEVSPYIGGDGYFRPLNMLKIMNPGIQPWLDTLAAFIRWTALVIFFTVGVYKMLRVEWWC